MGSRFPLFVSLGAAMGALLVGFHSGVIAAALLFLEGEFSLTTVQEGMVVSLLLIGAGIGAFLGGFLADFIGRKRSLFITVALFLAGSFLLSIAESYLLLLVGRFVAGLGVGIASVLVPLYIAEIAPPKSRGALGSLNQLFMSLGILIAYLISLYFADFANWRAMFFCGLFLALGQLIFLFFIPETPCWLSKHGQKKEATKVLSEIQVSGNAMVAPGTRTKGWGEFFQPAFRKVFWIGIGVSVFQQVTGINTVIYYAPHIFQIGSELTVHEAISLSILTAILNVATTFMAIWLVDRIGRRPLLLFGYGGLAASLLSLSISFQIGGLFPLLSALSFVFFFGLSVGPCTWLILSEIFPEEIRGRAMGIPLLVNWFSNYLVSLTFLSFVEEIGATFTFLLYGILALFACYFVWKMVPETRGKTLQQIQNFWKREGG